MKCVSCFKWRSNPDYCEHCGAGKTAKLQPTVEPAAAPADAKVRAAALERMRRALASRKHITKADIWQPILDRHARGEHVLPHALRLAREAMGQTDDDLARGAVDDELKNKGVVPGGAT